MSSNIPQGKNEKPSILFVCTANVIRSPMAEAFLKDMLRRNQVFSGWQVNSAGVRGLSGEPAAPQAQLVMQERGFDLSLHIARKVNEGIIHRHDLILTMEKEQQDVLSIAYPKDKGKILFIGEIAGRTQDVADPLAGSVVDFQITADEIKSLIDHGFLWIVLLANQNNMGYIEKFRANFEINPKDHKILVEEALRAISDRPAEIKYALLRMMMQIFPKSGPVLHEITNTAPLVPPTQEEELWLKRIQCMEIVLPITCMKVIKEGGFRHPEIETKLDIIYQRLDNPANNEIYKDLEQLFRKNYPDFKYRLGIWDLTVKYPVLPHRVGDYEEAYRILRGSATQSQRRGF